FEAAPPRRDPRETLRAHRHGGPDGRRSARATRAVGHLLRHDARAVHGRARAGRRAARRPITVGGVVFARRNLFQTLAGWYRLKFHRKVAVPPRGEHYATHSK